MGGDGPKKQQQESEKGDGRGRPCESRRGGRKCWLSSGGPEGMAAAPWFHHSESRKLGLTQELTPICPSSGDRHRGLLPGRPSGVASKAGVGPATAFASCAAWAGPRAAVLRERRDQCPLRSGRARPALLPLQSQFSPRHTENLVNICGMNVSHRGYPVLTMNYSRQLWNSSSGQACAQCFPSHLAPEGPL